MKNLKSHLTAMEPDLTPELEWLLQSHQFTQAQVAEVLIRTCYPDLYRWMVLCLSDEELAATSSLKTILLAAENDYNYSGDSGVLVWLFRLGAQEIRHTWRRQRWKNLRISQPGRFGSVQSPGCLPEEEADNQFWLSVAGLHADQRLALTLICGMDWSSEQAAKVLEVSIEQASHLLKQAVDVVYLALPKSTQEPHPAHWKGQAEAISTSFKQALSQWPDDAFNLGELADLAKAEINRRAHQRTRLLYWKETLWLAGTTGLIVVLLWAINLWLPGTDIAPEALPGGDNLRVAPSSLVVTPSAESDPAGPMARYQVQSGDSLAGIASFLEVPEDELRQLNPDLVTTGLRKGQTLSVMLHNSGLEAFPTPDIPEGYPATPLDFWLTPREFFDWLIITPARWTTVWLEGTVYDYGPLGVIRTPDQTRFQAWFSKPDRDLIIQQGPEPGLSRKLTLGEWQYADSPQGVIEIRKIDRPSEQGLTVRNLVSPGRIAILQQPGIWNLLRVETVAGRSAVIAEWQDHLDRPRGLASQAQADDEGRVTRRRFWIDIQSGVILRVQELVGNQKNEVVKRELIVNNIQYDRVFPRANLFAPWALTDQTFLDQNSSRLPAGKEPSPALTQIPIGREKLVKIPPGPDFDPSTARLTFQFPENSSLNRQQDSVDVFADSAYLGQALFSNPDQMICVRSPDGKQLAYTYDPFGNPDIMGIGWFRLEYPLRFNRLEIPLIPDSLAISPNGRYLAYFASPLHASPGSLSLIEMQTGRTRQLAQLIYATSLVWGPDGKSLAMIVADPENEKREVRILDTTSNQFTYHQKVSIESIKNPDLRSPDWPSPDWPAQYWGVTFPVPESSLQDCLQP